MSGSENKSTSPNPKGNEERADDSVNNSAEVRPDDRRSDQLQPTGERVHKFLTEDLTVRASAVIATKAVDEMRSIQNSYPIATVAVGRTMVGSLLMASHLKQEQKLSLYFQGNGPLSRVFAEASYEGSVRGYCMNPQYQVPIDGPQISTGTSIGIGLFTVTHHLPTGDEPHRGTVIIRTGEVGDDIAFYLHQSHQIPSVVALGVQLNSYGLVEAAGGVLIEVMPGHSEETIAKIEARAKSAPSISKRILEGATATDLIKDYLGDFGLMELEHPYPVAYTCQCSYDRVLRSVMLLGLEEIDKAIAEHQPLDVQCEFCGRKYGVSEEDLTKLRTDIYKVSLN